MSISDRLRALRTVWPLLKRAVLSGQLFRPRCELTQPVADILCEYNVRIPIADGVVLTSSVHYRETVPGAHLRKYSVGLVQANDWNRAGDRQVGSLRAEASVTLRNFWTASLATGPDFRLMSATLTRGGPLMGGPGGNRDADRYEPMTPPACGGAKWPKEIVIRAELCTGALKPCRTRHDVAKFRGIFTRGHEWR